MAIQKQLMGFVASLQKEFGNGYMNIMFSEPQRFQSIILSLHLCEFHQAGPSLVVIAAKHVVAYENDSIRGVFEQPSVDIIPKIHPVGQYLGSVSVFRG